MGLFKFRIRVVNSYGMYTEDYYSIFSAENINANFHYSKLYKLIIPSSFTFCLIAEILWNWSW